MLPINFNFRIDTFKPIVTKRIVMNRIKAVLIGIVILLGILVYTQYPKLTIISGYAAKSLASSVYISERIESDVVANDLNVPLVKLANTLLLKTDNSVRVLSDVFGLQQREAFCREGLGCVLLPKGVSAKDIRLNKPERHFMPDSIPYPFGILPNKDTIFPEVNYKLLETALDSAFARPEIQRTNSILVLYKDRILAERYAEGYNENTPLLGWSMTKSVLGTLYGIRMAQHSLNVYDPINWEPWSSDSRKNITYDDLLRMQSGLAWDEDYTTISDATRMLFLSEDMSKVQSLKEVVDQPGILWNYSSGTSNFLSGLLRRDLVDYQEYLDFPYRELIDKIGMHSMVLETDLSGNYVGSSYGWASTRDWAKFGLLYLHKGTWNGIQLFNPEWVDYVTKPTDNSDLQYGAHFWLNLGRSYPDAPQDMYAAKGYQGQYVLIIPSKEMVIVRTGLAEEPDFDANGFLKLFFRSFPS